MANMRITVMRLFVAQDSGMFLNKVTSAEVCAVFSSCYAAKGFLSMAAKPLSIDKHRAIETTN